MMNLIGDWIAALIFIIIMSYLFIETRFFKAITFVVIGVAVGHSAVVAINTIVSRCIKPIAVGNIAPIIPVIIGLLLFSQFSKNYKYLGRYPIGMIVGVTTGVSVRGMVETDLVNQIIATIKLPVNNISNIIFIICLVCALSTFIFTKKLSKPWSYAQNVGRCTLMLYFGWMFGSRFFMFTGILIDRFRFVLSVFGIL